MVASGIVDLRSFQWGVETTRGTSVPATSKILVPFIDFEPTDAFYRATTEARGLIQRNKGYETVIGRGSRFTVPDAPVIVEQMQNWLSMSVKGGVAGVASAPTTWTYTRSPVADPALQSWTLERRLNSGGTFIDEEWAYALLSKIGWKGGENQPLMFNAEGFARRVQSSTHTAALSLPTPEIAINSLTKVYIDSTWATLGTTVVAGQMIDWDLSFMTGVAPMITMDQRPDQDFQGYVLSSENVQLALKLRMLVKPGSFQYATEKTAAEAGTIRAVRIQYDGAAARQIQWDMLLKHTQASVFKIGEFQGQDIVEMNFEETADGTNLFQVKVSNLVATMI